MLIVYFEASLKTLGTVYFIRPFQAFDKATEVYRNGISVVITSVRDIESRLERTVDLDAWFIKIVPQAQI